ncbi:MAG: hypothetical protein Terrestrivirus4_131 [Terrestrivirus sp.]|uniref:Uncharacterized protein n=1 Tax=Terrestrivirus sp. TaxID=2487775 RepID=A0A3G4ZR65_9VIRU|nr:MAG: hypothetical protein Terrestrivirus4_131 [Terrestrivirus sp.]
MSFQDHALRVCKNNAIECIERYKGFIMFFNENDERIPIFFSNDTIIFGLHEKIQSELGKIYDIVFQDDKIIGQVDILNFYSNLKSELQDINEIRVVDGEYLKGFKVNSIYTSGTNFMNFIIKIAELFEFHRLELKDGSYLPLLVSPTSKWGHYYKLNLAIVRYLATEKTFYEGVGFEPIDEKEYRQETKYLDDIKMIKISMIINKINEINREKFISFFIKELKLRVNEITLDYVELNELNELIGDKTVQDVFISFYKRENLVNNKQISIIFYLLCYVYERINNFKQLSYYLNLHEEPLDSDDSYSL